MLAIDETHRIAVAQGKITMKPSTFELVQNGTAKKGDVIGIARVAAIMASKKTSELIPLCRLLSVENSQYDKRIVLLVLNVISQINS